MDVELLKSIFENRFAIPENYEVAELTPKLMESLGAVISVISYQLSVISTSS